MDGPAPGEVFCFNGFQLDRAGACLFRENGTGSAELLTLGSRAIALLALLLERQGKLVTKDEIFAAVWRGTTVEEANLTVQISALRRILDRDRAEGSCIQTIPGRGYRFVVPVTQCKPPPSTPITQSFANSTGSSDAGEERQQALDLTATPGEDRPATAPARFPWRLRAIIGASLLALCLVAASGWYMLNGRVMEPARAAHLSIVALPFVNLSGDPSQDYFADGVSENLTTELSRIKDSFVIARDTAFTYRGKSVGAKEVGKELGVRYVLEGSAQRDQNRVRVNAQLIDAESGGLLWADRFEEDMADLFKLQDEVVARLASSLGYALTYAEGKKSYRSKDPDAIDLAMQGWTLIYGSFQQPWKEMRERINAARALFDQALKTAPNDADALAGSAATYLRDFTFEFSDAQTDYEAKVLGQASRAIGLAPDNPRPYAIKAYYLAQTSRPSEALGIADAGLAINPNFAPLLGGRIIAELFLGRFEQAKSDAERAMQLSPRDPYIGEYHTDIASAELGIGHFDAAIDEYRKAIDLGLRRIHLYAGLSAAYAQAGKMDEAKAALAELRRLKPAITIKWMEERPPNLSAVLDGLRKAGVPEE